MNKYTYTIKATNDTGKIIHQEEIMRLYYHQACQFFARMQPKYRCVQMINEDTGKIEFESKMSHNKTTNEIEFESKMSYAMWLYIYKGEK